MGRVSWCASQTCSHLLGVRDLDTGMQITTFMQTDADRFVIRDAHVRNGIALLQPRWGMSLLRPDDTQRAETRAQGPR